jgi:hypothetical protein
MNSTAMRPVCGTGRDRPFKRCTLCGTVWDTREAFLSDRHNRLDGYQFNMRRVLEGKEPEGLLIFTHRTSKCGTSLALSASSFRAENDRRRDVAR